MSDTDKKIAANELLIDDCGLSKEGYRQMARRLIDQLKECREENISMDGGLQDYQVKGTRMHRELARRSGDSEPPHFAWGVTCRDLTEHLDKIEQRTKEAAWGKIKEIETIVPSELEGNEEWYYNGDYVRIDLVKQAIDSVGEK